jgi:hypothetical protein
VKNGGESAANVRRKGGAAVEKRRGIGEQNHNKHGLQSLDSKWFPMLLIIA